MCTRALVQALKKLCKLYKQHDLWHDIGPYDEGYAREVHSQAIMRIVCK